MREIEQRAVAAFRDRFGAEPAVVASAPGRVNLIGEHTDYNEGFALPCAVDRRVAVAMDRHGTRLYSVNFEELRSLTAERTGAWSDYPSGVLWSLRHEGLDVPDFRAAYAGDVPLGGGLSSSAAIEAATAMALDRLFALDIDRRRLALLCQRAENRFVGVNSGVMDQYTSLMGKAGYALLLDCRTVQSEYVPLDLASAGLALLVCDTGVKRGLAATGFNDRRAVAERAAATLGLKALRDATVTDLERLSGEELMRARHVVTEDERTLASARALRAQDFAEFGRLMYASHASLRYDYEVSIPELDTFVEVARGSGALGARLTGGGFGGCAITLIAIDRVEPLVRATRLAFSEHGFNEPQVYPVRPSAGAEIIRSAR